MRDILEILEKGETMLYPTDTVWGIGCDATNEAAVNKVYTIKNRAESKSLIVLVDYILYEHNKHELEEFKKFTENLGFDFNIRPGNPKGMEEKEKPQPEISAINIPCEWLWKVMTINWNGDLLPCCEYVTWNGSGGYANYVVDQNKKNLSPLKKTNSVIDTWNGDKNYKYENDT